jgi:hypothetical protein
MSESLADLFPDADFRYHLTLRRVDPAEFFRARDSTGAILAERARWLGSACHQYLAVTSEAGPIIREFDALAVTWEAIKAGNNHASPAIESRLRLLGCSLEPDLLFLSAGADGQFRLRGGCLCFSTGWALTEKMGHTLDFIHAVVPGLNPALGAPIQQFLTRLKPGAAFLRDNWGIAATDEMNLHPDRRIPAPDPPATLDRLWLRVEHQALLALPDSRGIVFGIRIALHRLSDVASGPHARGLRRALATMPREVIAYKRLDRILPYLLNVV